MEGIVEFILPEIITLIELMGIFVVAYSALKSFGEYLLNTFFHKHYSVQSDLANGLASGLEFKMAAEILKTVLVREMSELLILGAVIVLRALLSFLIHFELRASRRESSTPKGEE